MFFFFFLLLARKRRGGGGGLPGYAGAFVSVSQANQAKLAAEMKQS